MKNTLQQNILAFSSKYIGANYDQYDCYDIVRLFYFEVLGIKLNQLDYDDPRNKNQVDHLFNLEKENFIKHNKPQAGDIIVFRVHNLAGHIGIYWEDDSFIHTMYKTGCVLDNLSKWKHKVIGFYRWPNLSIQ